MILLSGATGFIGRRLVEELLENGCRLKCLVRNPQKAKWLEKTGCEVLPGDVLDSAALRRAITGDVEAVIYLVGTLAGGRGGTYGELHVEGVKNTVEACAAAGVSRYLHISVLGARPHPGSRYFQTKWEGEEVVKNSSLDYTIFRPSVVFGREDRFTNLFASAMKISPVFFVPGTGKNLIQPVFVGDLAKMMRMSIERESSFGRTYEVGGPECLSFNAVIDLIAAALRKKVYKVHIPIPFFRPAAWLMEKTLAKPPLSSDVLAMFEEDIVTADRSIQEEFGIKEKPFGEGIKEWLG
jgi:NADH dehydrogenase